jgi:formamidopyrimidine-DNA glycosylase
LVIYCGLHFQKDEEPTSVRGFEHPKAPTRRVEPQEDFTKPEYIRKAKEALPPGTQYVVLPEVGNEVLQDEFDLNELADNLRDLKRKVKGLQEIVDDAVFATDDFASKNSFYSSLLNHF